MSGVLKILQHPDINGPCDYGKPNPGMIKQDETEFNLGLSKSVLIGDNISDIMADKNAGAVTNGIIPSNKLPKYLFL
jgi:histidinol phosphatase-like enzyme